MHFWSLSAEEQYYLFWPIILVLFRFLKTAEAKIVILICVLFTVLFGTSIYFFVSNYLNTVGSDNYYSMLVRCWEIMAGAGIALLMNFKKFQRMIQKIRENPVFNFGSLSVLFFSLAIACLKK